MPLVSVIHDRDSFVNMTYHNCLGFQMELRLSWNSYQSVISDRPCARIRDSLNQYLLSKISSTRNPEQEICIIHVHDYHFQPMALLPPTSRFLLVTKSVRPACLLWVVALVSFLSVCVCVYVSYCRKHDLVNMLSYISNNWIWLKLSGWI